MRRTLLSLVSSALVVLAISSSALASNVHFIGAAPTFTYNNNGSYTVSGFTIAGLGNQPVTESLTVNNVYTATCVNHGGNVAPGQNPVTVSQTSTQAPLSGHNGTYTFGSLTGPAGPAPLPSNYSAKQVGCPNNNWTVSAFTLSSSSATLTVSQGNQIVYTQTYP